MSGEAEVKVVKEKRKSIFADNQTSTEVTGFVRTTGGQPVCGGNITIGGKSAFTDRAGEFALKRASVGVQKVCLEYRGRVYPALGDVEVKPSTIVTLEVILPLQKSGQPHSLADKQWVRLRMVSEHDHYEHISVLVRLNHKGQVDQSLETYGHLSEWKEDQYVRYPFLLRFDGNRGIMDIGGLAKTPRVILLDIYNRPIALGVSVKRSWEDLGSMEGFGYTIEDIELVDGFYTPVPTPSQT